LPWFGNVAVTVNDHVHVNVNVNGDVIGGVLW
jgi:hypothetical protein